MAPPGSDNGLRVFLSKAMDDDAAPYFSHIHGRVDVAAPVPMHMLPCSIQHNGPAPVSQFFQPSAKVFSAEDEAADAEVQVKEAAFRGRRLLGATVTVPPGFIGIVLESHQDQEHRETPGDGNGTALPTENGWTVQSTFDAVTYWNHGTPPSRGDPLQRCMAWLRLSQQIHSPVEEADMMAMASQQRLSPC